MAVVYFSSAPKTSINKFIAFHFSRNHLRIQSTGLKLGRAIRQLYQFSSIKVDTVCFENELKRTVELLFIMETNHRSEMFDVR